MDLAIFLPLRALVNRSVEAGLNPEIVRVILSLPLMAGIVALSRHLVGLTGFGLMTPIILAMALLSGGWWALMTFIVILFIVTLVRLALRKMRLRFLSRMALIIACLSILIFVYLALWTILSISVDSFNFSSLFLLIVFADIFVNLQVNRSLNQSVRLAVSVLTVALVIVGLLNLNFYRGLVLNQPELVILVSLFLIYFSARYTGLRFLEMIRFRQLISR